MFNTAFNNWIKWCCQYFAKRVCLWGVSVWVGRSVVGWGGKGVTCIVSCYCYIHIQNSTSVAIYHMHNGIFLQPIPVNIWSLI